MLAYGNNKDKINEVLHAYELPELTDKTAMGYRQRIKKYPTWAKDSLKDLILYYKEDKHVPLVRLTFLTIVQCVAATLFPSTLFSFLQRRILRGWLKCSQGDGLKRKQWR